MNETVEFDTEKEANDWRDSFVKWYYGYEGRAYVRQTPEGKWVVDAYRAESCD